MDSKHNGVPDREQRLDAVVAAYFQAVEAGQRPDRQELLARHADLLPELAQFFEDADAFGGLALRGRSEVSAATPESKSVAKEIGAGRELGDFRIVGELGRGGMGVVYHAEQISLKRPVALKVLPQAATLDPRQRQRFQNEAQAAASLQHPHIVAVYAVGCEGSIPYYAMQLICGSPLTPIIQQQQRQQSPAAVSSVTADQSLASTSHGSGSAASSASPSDHTTAYTPPPVPRAPSALLGSGIEAVSSVVPSGVEPEYYRWVAQLGVQAAEALDHAHQMGVVHRDVKPGNLLLDGKGRVWITDFGLAMVRQHEGSLTQSGDLVGTIRYMSPEQALAQRAVLDHRTDVYSLGTTLYELLVLQPAFVSTDRQELLRQVVHDEPVRPQALRRSIPLDLETIILKAMEKRPQDRYATAQEMADDLRRFLEDQPIQARRPNILARIGRWARRNRALVGTLAVSLVVVLLVSTLAAVIYARQQQMLAEARQEKVEEEQRGRQQALESGERMRVLADKERQAKEAEQQAKQIAENRLRQIIRAKDLLSGIFEDLDPRVASKGWPGLQEQLKQRVAKVAQQLAGEAVGDPLLVADLQNTLGHTLWVLGEPGLAISLFRQAYTTQEEKLGPDHPSTLINLNNLATAYKDAGQLDKALHFYQQALAKQKEKLGPDHPNTLTTMNGLAMAYQNAGQLDKALPLLEETLAKRKEKLGLDDPHTLATMNNLAVAYQAVGQLDKALPLLEQTLAKLREKQGPDYPFTLVSMNGLAQAYQAAGMLPRAVPLLEQALTKMKEKVGTDHPDTLSIMNNLGLAYLLAGQLDKALPLLEQTLARMKEKLGPDHPHTLTCMDNLARAYRESGQMHRALPLLEQTLVRRREKLRPNHPDTLTSMNHLAMAYQTVGQLSRALPLFEQALGQGKQKLGPDHPDTLQFMNNLAAAYHAAGWLSQALPLYLETLAKRRDRLGTEHPDTLQSMNNLAMAYQDAGQLDKALPFLKQTLAKQKDVQGPDHPDTLASMNNLACAYKAAGQLDKALPLLEQTLARRTEKMGADHPETLRSMSNLAAAYEASGQQDRALRLREEALQRTQDRFQGIPSQLAWMVTELGGAYERAGRLEKGEVIHRQVLAQARQQDPESHQTAFALAALGFNLLQQKKYADAEPFLRESLHIRETKQPGAWTTFNTQSLLGGALLGQRKHAEAEPLLTKGYRGMKDQEAKIPPQGKVRLIEALQRLVELHEATGTKEEASRWRKILEQTQAASRKPRPASAEQPKKDKEAATKKK